MKAPHGAFCKHIAKSFGSNSRGTRLLLFFFVCAFAMIDAPRLGLGVAENHRFMSLEIARKANNELSRLQMSAQSTVDLFQRQSLQLGINAR